MRKKRGAHFNGDVVFTCFFDFWGIPRCTSTLQDHIAVYKIIYIDYKTVDRLRHFVTDRGKILPRRITGSCARHQRMLTRAIKRARNIALIPFKAK